MLTGTAVDKAGNISTIKIENINIDKTQPEITVHIKDGDEYVLKQDTKIEWTAIDKLSGIEHSESNVQSSESIDTSSVGVKTVSITAVDKASNIITKSVNYYVRYNFNGLFAPLKNDKKGTFNLGRDIPGKI